ncbi:ER membrane protein DP1/Yop1 [Coemansia sp. RSA 2711]|nr:ER membrane protein DP1/Yop1 [Coemansia sp. RSA 2711]KAJ1842980.1 ER membrane protein DP1/Yop1 [Coemansia sp. RSA 2708]KAJ2311032.1 ER membrane protein DP1/Yop1 [Coemansia sp. RSA 2705]KAJ2319966.1 ER membrane protein DP1/Yop1 [Coemansia sp. RSA 2704]KAJ2325828.1 ER membrane protein DP1/Yop1 [Coemansia sp. RSA 2702]KAJ2368580.1 ER membrane protein DP1/Yop1 [Coemansia sp. RSA 2610]KAJ2390542.1 ER membrane protein DP1/Yop1 [Coemansia sp. RSA 2611]KAJ2737872.1 ER membrane protein DP1/Yop1 [C
MEQAHGIFNRYYNVADAHLARIPAAQSFQAKTGVPKVYGAAGVASIGLLLVFLNVGASLLVNLTGFGYAAYASMCAIETPGKEDDAQWLTYWVVFGLFNVVEYFTGFLLYWFPFYYLIKLGFLVWLMLPATRGAERLYHAGIKPVLQQARAHHAAAPAQPTSSAKAAEPKSD